jgi:hypothetical protein
MKFLLALLALFTLAITALHAADVVTITSATSVLVNGVDYGKPADAIANNKQLAPAIQLALEKWAADITADKATAEAERNALKARISTVLNTMLTEELKTGDGPKAELLRKLIAESQKSDADLKREALAAEISAKQAELQKLTGP